MKAPARINPLSPLSFDHQICVVLRQHPVMPRWPRTVTRYFIIKMRSRPGTPRGQEGSVPLTCKNIISEPSISPCISKAGVYLPFHQYVMMAVTILRFWKSLHKQTYLVVLWSWFYDSRNSEHGVLLTNYLHSPFSFPPLDANTALQRSRRGNKPRLGACAQSPQFTIMWCV